MNHRNPKLENAVELPFRYMAGYAVGAVRLARALSLNAYCRGRILGIKLAHRIDRVMNSNRIVRRGYLLVFQLSFAIYKVLHAVLRIGYYGSLLGIDSLTFGWLSRVTARRKERIKEGKKPKIHFAKRQSLLGPREDFANN
jgi:hypothetical protein